MFFLLGMLCPVHSQEDVKTDTVKIYFQQGKSVYNPDFRDNQSRLANFANPVWQILYHVCRPSARIRPIPSIASTS